MAAEDNRRQRQRDWSLGLEQFEIVSAKIPDTWVVVWNAEGAFSLTTEAWSEPGFWEAYYDGDPPALRKFEDGKKQIIDADQ